MKFLLRSIFIVFLTIILLLAGFYFWASSPTPLVNDYNRIVIFDDTTVYQPSDTLSMITYNIGYLSGMTNNRAVDTTRSFFQKNLDRVQQLFSNIRPSFVAFQEVDFFSQRSFFMNQFDSLANAGGLGYGAYAVNWDKKYVPFPYWPVGVHFGQMLSGQGVLSRFPVVSNRRIVLSKPEDNPFYYNAFYLDRLIQVCKIRMNEDTLILINVHLEAFDTETREKQSVKLKEVVREYMGNPLILAGDFNCPPPYDTEQEVKEQTLLNILAIEDLFPAVSREAYLEDSDSFYTFDSSSPHEMIDQVYYNSRIIPVRAEVIQSAGQASDHLPVYFEFIVRN